MAFAREAIETAPGANLASRLRSKRPLLLLGGAFVGILSAALYSVSAPRVRRAAEGEVGAVRLVPDHEGAQAAFVQLTQAGVVSLPGAPPPSDRLPVVQGPLPKVSALGLGPADGAAEGLPIVVPTPGTPPGSALPPSPSGAATWANLYSQHTLALSKGVLDLQRAALTAGTRVKAFDTQRKEEAQQAAQLLESIGGAGAGMMAMPSGLPGGGANAFMQAAGPSLALAQAAGVGGLGAGEVPPSAAGGDPQVGKLQFFKNGGEQLPAGSLEQGPRPPKPFQLLMGSILPGILISGINSESPGQIVGQLSENVYDSATGRHLLLPQGTRLVGTYSAFVSQGQTRVQVAWVRANMPNGATLDLGGMAGADQAGVSGFKDKVNRHFWARLGAALMTSSLVVGYELTAPQNGGQVEGAVHRGVGESLVQLGADMAKENAQIPPTLEIRPGYRFSILVSKDIPFSAPYQDGISRDGRRR